MRINYWVLCKKPQLVYRIVRTLLLVVAGLASYWAKPGVSLKMVIELATHIWSKTVLFTREEMSRQSKGARA